MTANNTSPSADQDAETIIEFLEDVIALPTLERIELPQRVIAGLVRGQLLDSRKSFTEILFVFSSLRYRTNYT